MEAQGLLRETLFQAIENFQELARERIGRVVTATVKRLAEGLLEEELARNLGAEPCQRTQAVTGAGGSAPAG